jgi:hypothetical protein
MMGFTKLNPSYELLKGLFEDDGRANLRGLWKELREKITDLLPTRNVIAHQPVRRLGTHDGQKAVYIYGIHVEPYQRYQAVKRHEG